ncbi:conserved hypothetical protein [Vibrio nigripulchritudo SFn27]|uniref:DUF3581 domain-containing protein n=1 Tax=Vibrio nigripulchritudo TaxID=28173 RepID=U4K3U3_9VIBR|nr:DUF3581 domain-containing protein [Vibrio nigripulchritudo]CCN34345.1 conserved hypothetical protein [Vibrio nigripulchritudo AM115]CCN43950.1 conserved hypothetical protein [Vibrio nigripulchritudo FTn2]CCN62806.1 conserved hypothetical protein [Vibrio nigripulchritudo POn4]CCN71966.1 conserved hypothetical protein [Vibrio nigripulchritudo SFn118]CCN79560.1 conserved hypothetical protein [Vibrio nigripulchritudo SO65]
MFLTPYFSIEDNQFQFTRQQASHFAKKVAGDYNPIHDEDNKRFCVPGDLLFAVLLNQEGVSQKMRFDFSGMVSEGIALSVAEKGETESALVDANGKEYLHMHHEGEVSKDAKFIEHLTKSYVQFSGMNFPHIMVPLMEDKQMMINCQRPLVMYESMEVEFDRLDLSEPSVEFAGATFEIEGKRGQVTLNFSFTDNGEVVGKGVKRMVASGLRPYEKEAVDDLVERFNARKDAFIEAQAVAA